MFAVFASDYRGVSLQSGSPTAPVPFTVYPTRELAKEAAEESVKKYRRPYTIFQVIGRSDVEVKTVWE